MEPLALGHCRGVVSERSLCYSSTYKHRNIHAANIFWANRS